MNDLKLDMKFLTPSNQTIKDNGGKTSFEGRNYTYFNRLGTVVNRQWQKILRILHVINNETPLTNKDALNILNKHLTNAFSHLNSIDPATLQQNMATTKEKITLLSLCLSNQSEIEEKNRLLGLCDELIASKNLHTDKGKGPLAFIREKVSSVIPGFSSTSQKPVVNAPQASAVPLTESFSIGQVDTILEEHLGDLGAIFIKRLLTGAERQSLKKTGDLYELTLKDAYHFHYKIPLTLSSAYLNIPQILKVKFSESGNDKTIEFVTSRPVMKFPAGSIELISLSFTKEKNVIVKTTPPNFMVSKVTKTLGYDFSKGASVGHGYLMGRLDKKNYRLEPGAR